MKSTKTGAALAVVIFTAFVNFVGMTIVIPILTPICIPGGLFFPDPSTSKTLCTAFLGLLLGLFPLCQFFSAPIVGAFSDRIGRRRVLLYSIAGMTAGYIILGLAMLWKSPGLALFGRVVQGVFSGSLAVIQSAISDLSDEKTRTRNFGLFGAALGASMFVGPALGGLLSDRGLVSWFSYATPFWVAAILGVFNYFQVAGAFSETLPLEKRRTTEMYLLSGPVNIFRVFGDPLRRQLFLAVFLFGFGFNFFIQFFQYFLIEKFSVTQTQLGLIFSYVGIVAVLTQAGAVSFVSRRFSARRVLAWTLLQVTPVYPLLLLMPSYGWIFALVFLSPLLNGISLPNLTTIVSSLADSKSQGEILGVNQSVMAIAQFLPPLIGGFFVGLHYTLPLWISGFFIFLSWAVFITCPVCETVKRGEG